MWCNNYEIESTQIGRLAYNSDLLEEVNYYCEVNNISTGWVSIIGAVKTVKLGFYDQEKKEYVFLENIKSDKPFEISSCSGNISVKDGKPFAHIHIVVSDRNGNCFGGHVMPGTIIFAGEAMIQSFKGENLVRGVDEDTKLPLWVK